MTPPYPEWLEVLAWASLILGFASAGWIVLDEGRRPQRMWIMNLVWPVTALYFGPLAVWLYCRTLPQMKKRSTPQAHTATESSQSISEHLDRTQTSVAAFHCGAGCALGDLVGETAVPFLGLTFAGELGSRLVADFVLAYILGIVFQYFTIVPMRGLSLPDGLKQALRADTISIILFEVGMFGWMALTYFVLFPSPHLKPSHAVFWFMMQIAMIAGFMTSYPANGWLLKKGWKEKMPQRQHEERARDELLAA